MRWWHRLACSRLDGQRVPVWHQVMLDTSSSALGCLACPWCLLPSGRGQVGGTYLPRGKGGHPMLIPVSQEELPWCPCSLEDHGAILPVEGEVGDVDDADAAVDGRGQPVDAAIRGHQHIGVEGDFERPVNAGGERMGSAPSYAWAGSCQPYVGTCPHCPVTYLFSRTISGSQTMVEGTRSSWMLSYFSGSQRRR